MGYQRNFRGNKSNGKKKSNFDTTQLSALWGTKREGLWVGTIKDLNDLIALIKKARAAGKGITLFLWENKNDKYPGDFNLTANVERDNPNSIRDNGGDIDDSDGGGEEEEDTDL